MFEGIGIFDFVSRFKTDADCKKYLYEFKWGKGFVCKRCGHTGWSKTKDPYVRKCNRCKHKESATAGTLFHQCKFSLRKAFMIVYYMSTTKKGISSYELERQLGLRQKTCWLFQSKIRRAMDGEGEAVLTRQIAVDEFVVGGPEESKKGRSKGKKKEVVMAIKYDKFGIHRCYARQVKGCGAKQLRPFFEEHIDKQAEIKTDRWRGYKPLKREYAHLCQVPSKGGKNFPLMHRQIMMLKAWLRGIHHHCEHLQYYLDEYFFRFNRNRNTRTIFHELISKMMDTKPMTYKNFQLLWGN